MVCPTCGSEANPQEQICFQCGRFLGAAVTQGTVVAGRYEVLSPLGRGGVGMLYEARDLQGGATVALEVLRSEWHNRPDMVRRFLWEMKVLRDVVHPNVCRTLESGEDGGIIFHVMEFVEGKSLKKAVQAQGGLPRELAFDVCIQIADGLQALHKAGIVHRSIKTSNVLLAGTVAKIIGFDMMKNLATAASPRTMTGTILGSVDYISPEQARGEGVYFPSDIYSLGLVIYEVFTGHPPFRGNTAYAIVMKHLQEPPPLDGPEAARIPQSLVPVLRKALAKEPGRRHQMVRHLAEGLRVARREGAVEDPVALLSALNPIDATVKVDLGPIRAVTEPNPDLEKGTLLRAVRGESGDAPPSADGPKPRPTYLGTGPSGEEGIRVLLRALVDKDDRERNETFDVLGLMGPDTHAALTVALTDDDPVIRQIANEAVHRILSRARSTSE